jgi:hypothetical protein
MVGRYGHGRQQQTTANGKNSQGTCHRLLLEQLLKTQKKVYAPSL